MKPSGLNRSWFLIPFVVSVATLVATKALTPIVSPSIHSLAHGPGTAPTLFFALAGFVTVGSLAWMLLARDRPSALVIATPVIAFLVWILGAHRLQASMAEASTGLPLDDRIAVLVGATKDGVEVWSLGALLVAFMLSTAAMMFGARASWRNWSTLPSLRGVIALITGTIYLGTMAIVFAHGTAWGPITREGRNGTLIAIVPAALGVMATFLASGSIERGPRVEAERDISAVTKLSVLAIVFCALHSLSFRALDLAAPLDGFDGTLAQRISKLSDRLWIFFAYSALSLVPVLIAHVIVVGLPKQRNRGSLGGGAIAAAFVALALLVLGAGARWKTSLAGLTSAEDGIVKKSAALGIGTNDGCKTLVESTLVHVTPRGIHGDRVGSVDFEPHSCGAAVLAIDKLGKTNDVWLSVDPSTSFERVGCLFDELARSRGPIPRDATRGAWRIESSPGCRVNLVGQKEGKLTCAPLDLPDPRCRAILSPLSMEAYEAEQVFEVALEKPPIMRWMRGNATRHVKVLDEGRGTLSELVSAEWKAQGWHRDPADRRFDIATLRALPEAKFADVTLAIEAFGKVTRETRSYESWSYSNDRVETVPAFDLALASMGYRSALFTEEMIPMIDLATVAERAAEKEGVMDAEMKAKLATKIAASSAAYTRAAFLCEWMHCSASIRARLSIAKLSLGRDSRDRLHVLAQAQTLEANFNPLLEPAVLFRPSEEAKMPYVPVLTIEPDSDDFAAFPPMARGRLVANLLRELRACLIFDAPRTDANATPLRTYAIRGRVANGVVAWATSEPSGSGDCIARGLNQLPVEWDGSALFSMRVRARFAQLPN